MNNNLFLLLLISHVISDYYLQSANMAKKKMTNIWCLIGHSMIYASASLVLLSFFYSQLLIPYYLIYIGLHFLIDLIKTFVNKTKRDKRVIYIIDQLMHFIVIIILSIAYYNRYGNIQLLGFIDQFLANITLDRNRLLRFILLFLLILKPTNTTFQILFSKIKKQVKYQAPEEESDPFREKKIVDSRHAVIESDSESKMGALIGDMERILVIILLILNQYTAIGLVLTGKSVARYNSNISAEYYIIGTFYSLLVAIASFILIWLL